MNKKLLYIVIGVVIVVVAAFLIFKKPVPGLLGEDIKFYIYTVNNEPTGGAVVSIPFKAEADDRKQLFAQLLVDFDKNEVFGPKEVAVRNQLAQVRKAYRNNLTFSIGEAKLTAGDTVLVRAVLSPDPVAEGWDGPNAPRAEAKQASVKIEAWELASILGLNSPVPPEGWLRGPGASFGIAKPAVALGAGGASASRPNVPDLPQDPMACAPTSVANNIISLAEEAGALEDLYENLPAGPWDVVRGLKTDMGYDEQVGVRSANVLPGKQAFIERHNLPIVTEIKENPTVSDITEALNSGAAVEAGFALEVGASGRFTGHMVSVTGVASTPAGGIQLQYHDGATPEGMDSLELGPPVEVRGRRRGPRIDYPLWRGRVEFIESIIIERWVGKPVPARAGPPEAPDGETTSIVEMLVINGQYYPRSQFRVAAPDRCKAQHYHAEGTVYGLASETSTQIVSMIDPAPDGCGFGTIAEVPIVNVAITYEQSVELIKYVVP